MDPETIFSEIYGLTDDILNSSQDVMLKVGGYSMFPCLKPGDIITIRRVNGEELMVGDIIVFETEKKWIAHRIMKIISQEDKRIFITKGDSCKTQDIPITEINIMGKVIFYTRNGEMKTINKPGVTFRNRLIIPNSPVLIICIRFWLWAVFLIKEIINQLMGIYKNMLFLTQSSKKIFRINIILSLFFGLLPLIVIYLVKWLIDELSRAKGLNDNAQFYFTVFIIGCIALAFFIQSILSIYSGITREKLSQSVSIHIYNLLYEKYASLELEYLEDATQQDKIHRAIQEAGFRPNKMINQYLSIVQSIVSWLFIAVLLFTIHWSVFFIILLAVFPGFWLRIQFTIDFYRFNKSNSKKEREAYYYNRILTGLPFAKELRLFGLKDFFISRFENIQRDLHCKKNKLIFKHVFPEILSQIFAVILMSFSFVFVTYLTINGVISLGTVILFFLLFQRGYAVMKDLLQSIAGLMEDNVFFEEFQHFLKIPTLQKNHDIHLKEKEIKKGIFLENVSFKYPSSKRNALHSVSIDIPLGKTIALVGANGSGKTTLIKLLCGFFRPQQGTIRFDDTNISLLSPEILRKQITAVFQDFALYNLTAKENIILGDITKLQPEDEIKNAARNADIADDIEQLPLSYQTMLGNLFEKGEELSIGQWQKMALAKAFFRNTPILLMDEPSSALDAETERTLLQNLRSLAQNKTVVIVSHRFSTIKWADIIYVLEKGTVVEYGNHEDLIACKGRYFDMYSAVRE
jgi:ATP-binding cassette, subfamily B, bacterial